MKRKLIPSIWFSAALLSGSSMPAISRMFAAEPVEEQRVLPLPESSEAGAKGGINPLLTMPPEGLPPLALDFKIEEIPPNDLSNWQIARLPARENRDALAAFWARVSRSKTRWVVSKDPKTGAAVANEGDKIPSPDEIVGAPKSVQVLGDNGELHEILPSRVWTLGESWLVVHETPSGKAELVLAHATGKGEKIPCDSPVHEVVRLKDRVFVLIRDQGKILEMIQRDGSFHMEEFYAFPNRTKVCALGALPDSRLCVVTQNQLVALALNKEPEVLLRNPGWSSYDPNSVLYDDKAKRVFVGMRYFVARCAIESGQRASVLLRPAD